MNRIRTDQQVRSAGPKEGTSRTDYSVEGVSGLQLRCTAAGTKSWRLKSQHTGLVTLGSYPDVGLAEARDAARALLSDAKRASVNRATGIPVLAVKDRRTLALLLDQYQARRGAAVRSWPAQRKSIERTYTHLLEKPAKMIDREAILLPVLRARSVSAKRSAIYLGTVLRWGRVGEPVGQGELNDAVPERPRERVLTDAEIRAILTAPLDDVDRDFMFALFLTMQRQGDVRAMRFDAIDADGLWTFELQKSRAREVVVHPLSRAMLDLVKRRRLALPGSDLVFPSAAGTVLGNMDRRLTAIQTASATSNWTLHDARRTSRTVMGRIGVHPHLAERCMNHAQGRIERVYDRYPYIDEMRDAYEALAGHIMALTAAKVVPMDRSRA